MAGCRVSGNALITGATGGIGRETAFTFAEAGAAAIIFADLDKDKAQITAEESTKYASHPHYRTIVADVDVTNPASVEAMVELAVNELGQIHYSINCFGVDNNEYPPISESSVEDFDRVMDINARGVMLCVRAVSKVMLEQESQLAKGRNGVRSVGRGSIVNLASGNSYVPIPGKTAYVASKHAVLGITRVAALEMAAKGVRVNAVCPSWVYTPMVETEVEKNSAVLAAINSVTPLKRAAQPEEVAEVVLFLCSAGASYVTGTGLLVDSGLTLMSSLT